MCGIVGIVGKGEIAPELVKCIADISPDDNVETQLADGSFSATVIAVYKKIRKN